MPSVIAPSDLSPEWRRLYEAGRKGEDVEVLSGNELIIRGVHCRLLGIRLLEDEDSIRKAELFLSRYMEYFGGYFGIWNDHDPIIDSDNVPLIWLKGHGNMGFAQEGLVRTGLATVHYGILREYRFHISGKDGSWSVFDWQKCLNEAEQDWKSGKKPNYSFGWPISDKDGTISTIHNASDTK